VDFGDFDRAQLGDFLVDRGMPSTVEQAHGVVRQTLDLGVRAVKSRLGFGSHRVDVAGANRRSPSPRAARRLRERPP